MWGSVASPGTSFEVTWAHCSILSGRVPERTRLTLPACCLTLTWAGPEAGTPAMCSPEEAALLRLEEVFSATLARINSLVLQPLLMAGESQLPRRRVGDMGTEQGLQFYLAGPSELQLAHPQMEVLTLGVAFLVRLASWPLVADCSFLRGILGARP